MRVGNSKVDDLVNGSVGSVGAAAPELRSSSTVSSAKSDSVILSGAVNLVALAKAGASTRQSKVESLGEQVKSGAYQADTAQVSYAVVQDHIAG